MSDVPAFGIYNKNKKLKSKIKKPNNNRIIQRQSKKVLAKNIPELKKLVKKEKKVAALRNHVPNTIQHVGKTSSFDKNGRPGLSNNTESANLINGNVVLVTNGAKPAHSKKNKKILKNKTFLDNKDLNRKADTVGNVVDAIKINNQDENRKNGIQSPTKKIKSPSKANKLLNSSSSSGQNNSIKDGENLFKWLIQPIELSKFMENNWEQAPCLIQRKNVNYFSNLLSFDMIDKMLLENHVEFTKNIDITSYKNGIRETLNPDGRAMPGSVWEKYADGCSIRILNPQTFLPSLFKLNATLQEYFCCMVGANVYLTPPNSQGFAPHYDDIEAFVLQIEGRKKWKLYNPRNKYEKLPRFSSGNFNENEIGTPILQKVLQPGDLLYFPRGTIHQACTEPGYHSLHITISVYQKQCYADLFEKMIPMILSKTIKEDVEMRKGLPLSIWSNFGVAFQKERSNERNNIFYKCKELLHRAISSMTIDDAVDQLAKRYLHDALPPYLHANEKQRTVFGTKNILNENGECVPNYEFNLETRIRLLRANILRLIHEENSYRVYFYTDNSKEYHEYEPNFLEINEEDVSLIQILINCYPNYVLIKDLPCKSDETKLGMAQVLFDRGILMTDKLVQDIE